MRSEFRRVVITGLGAVTPLGNSVNDVWKHLCAGVSGIASIKHFDAASFPSRIGGEVSDLILPDSISLQQARRMDRFALLALLAALEVWQDAQLCPEKINPYETGVLIGSSHGGETTLLAGAGLVLNGAVDQVSPRLIPSMLSNMASAQVALHLGLHGPSFGINTACATGAHAIGEAAEIIRRGDAQIMLCGGAEACLTPLTLAGDASSGALSRRNDHPAEASRPFDRNRDGFVLGEGAAVIVLESYEHALARAADIYGELRGYALSSDAFHITRPDPGGKSNAWAICRALAKADLLPSEINAIFAHATGTLLGDAAEAEAFLSAFGNALPKIPVTAIKGALGHLLGAAGAIQALAAVKALQTQTLPPTLNLAIPDPNCPLQIVTETIQRGPLDHVLSNSSGFGGHNAALIFSRVN